MNNISNNIGMETKKTAALKAEDSLTILLLTLNFLSGKEFNFFLSVAAVGFRV